MEASLSVIYLSIFCVVVAIVATIYFIFKDGKRKVIGGIDDLVGKSAKVIEVTEDGYKVSIYDVIWNAESAEHLAVGDKVKVRGYKDMVLKISR